MRIVLCVLWGVGAAGCCALALRWLGVKNRRLTALSLWIGVCCGLIPFFFSEINIGRIISLAVLGVLTALAAVDRDRPIASLIASAIAVACGGMIQTVVGAVWALDIFSMLFRGTLVVLYLAGACFLLREMEKDFPGEKWKEYLQETDDTEVSEEHGAADNGRWMELAVFFTAYGISCGLPVFWPQPSLPLLLLEVFAFFAGLELIGLLFSNQRERKQALTEKQYRDDMQTYVSVIRSQRHDYNFHVQTLHGLLLRKDYDACEKYLEELLADSVRMNRILPLADAAVSALLLSFQSRAAAQGIGLQIDIENDLSQIATNVYETNKIIGNLLQNAIDETERLKDKSYGIRFSVIKRGEFCVFHVSNRTEKENPMERYRVGHSDKEGHEGIGIASIRTLAERYGGVVYSRMEDDVIHFIAKIPLRLVKEEE